MCYRTSIFAIFTAIEYFFIDIKHAKKNPILMKSHKLTTQPTMFEH